MHPTPLPSRASNHRGFLLGGQRQSNSASVSSIRKAGALFPGSPGNRVLLVDDWADTGSQARAVQSLLAQCDAELLGVSVMVDELNADVRSTLSNIASLATFADLPTPD